MELKQAFAVILGWDDLKKATKPSSARVEFQNAVGTAVDYLSVWSVDAKGHQSMLATIGPGPPLPTPAGFLSRAALPPRDWARRLISFSETRSSSRVPPMPAPRDWHWFIPPPQMNLPKPPPGWPGFTALRRTRALPKLRKRQRFSRHFSQDGAASRAGGSKYG